MAHSNIHFTKELVPVFTKLLAIARLMETSQVTEVDQRFYVGELKKMLEGLNRATQVAEELTNQIMLGIPVDLDQLSTPDRNQSGGSGN